jgi:2-iminobutanoate/2-iminopropanoate deaminase
MDRRAIVLPGQPVSNLPFSEAIRFGNLLFTSGAVGTSASGDVPQEIRAQTRNCLGNLKAILVAAGSGLEHVLKTTVYLTDIGDFAAMNEVYRTYFTGDLPARSTVAVSALAFPELRVEIDMIAGIP